MEPFFHTDMNRKSSTALCCLLLQIGTLYSQEIILSLKMHPGVTVVGESGDTILIESNDRVEGDFWRARAILELTSSEDMWLDPMAAEDPLRVYRGKKSLKPAASPIANMAFVPSGGFVMGSPAAEANRFSNEGPQTRVTFSSGFWIGKHEVTQQEYLDLMGMNPSHFKGPAWGDDLNRPVESITWEEAVAYCVALSARERLPFDNRMPPGYEYRLPTEAEWEYACRAGMTTSFSFGASTPPGYDRLSDHAWYPVNSGSITHAVGGKKPNSWGLFDMHGNVVEWCYDLSDGSGLPGGAVTDPVSRTGVFHNIRGGSWAQEPRFIRSASRSGKSGTQANNSTGFRIVLAPVIEP